MLFEYVRSNLTETQLQLAITSVHTFHIARSFQCRPSSLLRSFVEKPASGELRHHVQRSGEFCGAAHTSSTLLLNLHTGANSRDPFARRGHETPVVWASDFHALQCSSSVGPVASRRGLFQLNSIGDCLVGPCQRSCCSRDSNFRFRSPAASRSVCSARGSVVEGGRRNSRKNEA